MCEACQTLQEKTEVNTKAHSSHFGLFYLLHTPAQIDGWMDAFIFKIEVQSENEIAEKYKKH